MSNNKLCLNVSLNGARCWDLCSKKWLMESHCAVTFIISGGVLCTWGNLPPCPAGPQGCQAPLQPGSNASGGGKQAVVAKLLPPHWKVLGESWPRMQKYPVCSWCSVLNPVKLVRAFLLIQRGFGSCSNSIINNLR